VNEKLSQEEEQIVEYIESGKAQSVPNVNAEMARYTQMAQEHNSKKKAISIRILESDLYLLKQNALKSGVSYQNIIQSLIHQYTHDQIKLSL
jgi:predicted DNA binding CopG/RHH family protein